MKKRRNIIIVKPICDSLATLRIEYIITLSLNRDERIDYICNSFKNRHYYRSNGIQIQKYIFFVGEFNLLYYIIRTRVGKIIN